MQLPFRTDLGVGATVGLALSVVVWSVALDPPALDVGTWLLLATAASAAIAAPRDRTGFGLDAPYALVLAALLARGAGTSILAALVAAAASAWPGGDLGRPRESAVSLIRGGAVRAIAAGAGATALGLASPVLLAPASWLLHGAAHALAWRAALVAFNPAGRRTPQSAAPLALLLPTAAGPALAWLLSAGGEPAFAAVAAGASLVATGAARMSQTRARREYACRASRRACRATALAIHPRDGRARERLRRVLQLADEMGAHLGASRVERDALADAAVVFAAEHLPRSRATGRSRGKRSRGGALASVPGCRDVAAILRDRHERWDGSGPGGLRGDEISLGARILAAIERFETLGSEREGEALALLQREAGHALDGRVVDALIEGLERREGRHETTAVGLSGGSGLLTAERELEALYEISRACGVEERLALGARRLAELVPHRGIVVYRLDDGRRMLRPCFAAGAQAAPRGRQAVPVGEGLSGRAALERRALRLDDCAGAGLAAPISFGERCAGVLTLFDLPERRFTDAERRVVARVAARLAAALVGADAGPPPEGALTDSATGLPSARLLRIEAARRCSDADGAPGYGLIALRLLGLSAVTERLGSEAADRIVARVARRIARASLPTETVVRFGPDLFLMLSGAREPEAMHRRWRSLALAVEKPLVLEPSRTELSVRFSAAHALQGRDGETLDELVATLDTRLALSDRDGRRLLAFPSRGGNRVSARSS